MAEVNNGAEAAGFAKLNFGPASSRDQVVYAAERPGMRNEFDKPGAIPKEAMVEWSEFMQAHGIKRGLSLMSDEEMTWFPEPGLMASGVLPHYDHVLTSGEGAGERVLKALEAAEAAGEKVVVHCCAGQHRTGMVLAAWLVKRYGLTPEQAFEEMLANAADCNVRRGGEPEKLKKLLGMS
eukprot:TRINITY_DN124534_c0_g1_i1.p1 TRINITY_DN124534_c0_g1~~TRINITY_DN124534_c0_g1_i1.p1  ORF type:complete len:180 (+),score=46.57 TRINITY_DN124534_c0_g1_i1:55-594(+)